MISTEEKLHCIEREIRMRERVYPRWVEQKRMSAEQAVREIETMREIQRDYIALFEKERLL